MGLELYYFTDPGFKTCSAPSTIGAWGPQKTHLKSRIWHHFETGAMLYTVRFTGHCSTRLSVHTVEASSLGGVPVLSLPSSNPHESSVSASPTAGSSPRRPAGMSRSPIWMTPRRNVPVVNTTVLANTCSCAAVMTPITRCTPSVASSESIRSCQGVHRTVC